MKQHIDEILLLGGLYVAAGTPLEYLHRYRVVDSLSKALLFAFVFIFLMLCFHHVPRLLIFVRNEHPKAAYYLRAIGCVPYAMIALLLVWDIVYALCAFPPHVVEGALTGLRVIFPFVLAGLLIKAYLDTKRVKKRRKK